MKIKEAIKDDLISAIGDEIGAKGMYGQTSNAATEIIKSMSELKKELGETKKKKKDGETDEAMGAVGAGGFSQPLFSVKKKDIEDVTKVETKEATGSVSSGSYVTTAAWAKSTKKKDWRGKSKTQIPGGKFVQVKKKCKKFPYCNQGDIGALKFTNENVADNVIKRLSEKYNLKESIIRDILSKHYDIKK